MPAATYRLVKQSRWLKANQSMLEKDKNTGHSKMIDQEKLLKGTGSFWMAIGMQTILKSPFGNSVQISVWCFKCKFSCPTNKSSIPLDVPFRVATKLSLRFRGKLQGFPRMKHPQNMREGNAALWNFSVGFHIPDFCSTAETVPTGIWK